MTLVTLSGCGEGFALPLVVLTLYHPFPYFLNFDFRGIRLWEARILRLFSQHQHHNTLITSKL